MFSRYASSRFGKRGNLFKEVHVTKQEKRKGKIRSVMLRFLLNSKSQAKYFRQEGTAGGKAVIGKLSETINHPNKRPPHTSAACSQKRPRLIMWLLENPAIPNRASEKTPGEFGDPKRCTRKERTPPSTTARLRNLERYGQALLTDFRRGGGGDALENRHRRDCFKKALTESHNSWRMGNNATFPKHICSVVHLCSFYRHENPTWEISKDTISFTKRNLRAVVLL